MKPKNLRLEEIRCTFPEVHIDRLSVRLDIGVIVPADRI